MNFIKSFILKAIAHGFALYITDEFLNSVTITGGPKGYVVLSIIITLAAFFIKPILKIISLPLMWITGGLFIFVINTIILYISGRVLPQFDQSLAFSAESIKAYFLAAALITVITWVEWLFLKPKK